MSISDFLNTATASAARFCGNPTGFFAALRNGNPVGTSLLEREYMSFLKGASRKAKFRFIFEALTPSKATATNNRLEQLGRQVAQLATSPNLKVSGPIVKGITKSLSAQEKIDARLAKVRQINSPRAKLAALKNVKNDVVMSQNDEHRAQCEASRDQILNSMRERISGQNA